MALTKVSNSMISGAVANILDFGAVADGLTNNHAAIMAAIASVYAKGGGTVFFPQGVFATAPISLQGYSDIILQGQGMHYDLDTVKNATTIKIISAGVVGVQFCSTTNPTPSWTAAHCVIENLTVDGNNFVDTCINGNYNFIARNVSVLNANNDGIVCEDLSYPLILSNVYSSRNGRHGCYVRGPKTTKFLFDYCRFDINDGYGLYIEGAGGGAHIKDCTIQSNKQGGVKIDWVGNLYVGSYFCGEMLFTNLYTEDNGLLSVSSPSYEGNYALLIDGHDYTAGSTGRPYYLRFVGGALNASVSGRAYNIKTAWTLDLGDIAVDHSLGDLPYPNALNAVNVAMKATSAGVANKYPLIQSYGIADPNGITPYQYFLGGISGSRGRVRVLEFYLPSIAAGATTLMKTPLTASVANAIDGYPMLKDGSVLSVQLIASPGGTGTLTTKGYFSYNTEGIDPYAPDNTLPQLTLNYAASPYAEVEYLPNQVPIPNSYCLGFAIVASNNYVAGATGVIQLFVMIES